MTAQPKENGKKNKNLQRRRERGSTFVFHSACSTLSWFAEFSCSLFLCTFASLQAKKEGKSAKRKKRPSHSRQGLTSCLKSVLLCLSAVFLTSCHSCFCCPKKATGSTDQQMTTEPEKQQPKRRRHSADNEEKVRFFVVLQCVVTLHDLC